MSTTVSSVSSVSNDTVSTADNGDNRAAGMIRHRWTRDTAAAMLRLYRVCLCFIISPLDPGLPGGVIMSFCVRLCAGESS